MNVKLRRGALIGGLLSAGLIACFFGSCSGKSERSTKATSDGEASARKTQEVADPARRANGDPTSLPRATPKADPAAPAPAATVAATPKSTHTAEPVVKARWGSAPGELGRKAANESSPEGPMSFEVDERGRAFVLDQVNSRVEVFEPGKSPRSIALPADTFQDLALTKNDGLVMLDRLTTGSVAFVDKTGKVTHEVGLAGKGIEEGGDVTALTQRPDGTWLEVKHANLVRVADADGNPLDERTIVQGRFAADGASVLRASRSGERALFVAKKTGRAPAEKLARVSFGLPLAEIMALETDASGRIFVGAFLMQESAAPPFSAEQALEVVVALASTGAELARYEFPASTGPEESFRRIRVGGDGAIYHLGFDDEGATLRRVRP